MAYKLNKLWQLDEGGNWGDFVTDWWGEGDNANLLLPGSVIQLPHDMGPINTEGQIIVRQDDVETYERLSEACFSKIPGVLITGQPGNGEFFYLLQEYFVMDPREIVSTVLLSSSAARGVSARLLGRCIFDCSSSSRWCLKCSDLLNHSIQFPESNRTR
jgi:hypothetical protein